MENISYAKIVLIGAGHVGSAILDSLLRMNLADEIVVINRNEKKALGVVLDASHTTAFAYSANANMSQGTDRAIGPSPSVLVPSIPFSVSNQIKPAIKAAAAGDGSP